MCACAQKFFLCLLAVVCWLKTSEAYFSKWKNGYLYSRRSPLLIFTWKLRLWIQFSAYFICRPFGLFIKTPQKEYFIRNDQKYSTCWLCVRSVVYEYLINSPTCHQSPLSSPSIPHNICRPPSPLPLPRDDEGSSLCPPHCVDLKVIELEISTITEWQTNITESWEGHSAQRKG